MTETLINPEIILLFQSVGEQHGKTLVNPAVQAMLDKDRPRRGTLLEGGYKIVEPIDVKSGEADLYLAEKEGHLFAVKLYHRDNAVKPEVSEKLAAIESPYIAKAVMRSFFRGMPFEVLPYYRGGSLKGKRFTLAEIKEKILPQLNEALHALHRNGILHKDVKPANLMQNEQGEAILIDFGISSAFTGGATVRVTETGMTIDYSAPEVFRNLYLVESDYYALGITLYELFTGHTPYHHLSEDAIMQYLALQRIPFPDDMPSELRDLILALTYHDLTARHDTANPNRRWTYEEVKAWLQGEKQIIPGHAKGGLLADEIPPYTFQKQTYTTLTSLVRALGESWNEGKNELFYSRLSSYFENVNPILARRTRAIEEEAKKRSRSDDFLFWKLLHQLDPDLKILYFRGAVFASLAALGRDMLEKLKNKKKEPELWDAILHERLLSTYLERLVTPQPALYEATVAIEDRFRLETDTRSRELCYYLAAYYLSGQTELYVDKQSFYTLDDLASGVRHRADESLDTLKRFANRLIAPDLTPSAQLEAWLTVLGHRDTMTLWQTALHPNPNRVPSQAPTPTDTPTSPTDTSTSPTDTPQ